MLIEAKIVRRSRSIDDLLHVFINFNFENDFSQLAIENPMVSSNIYAIHKVGKTSLPNCIKHSRAYLGLEGTAFPLARKNYNKAKGNYMSGFCIVGYLAN